MAIKPITGVRLPAVGIEAMTLMLRKRLVLDLSVAFGLGTSFGYLFWYGYHVPAVRRRDAYYAKLEDKRAADAAALQQA